ncbi:YfhO family protein [Flavobacterium gawalongense]|uniref:YfhO family protein n=1 Tax=Flavobacterium gawalongense TaxID=2594432 RepID=A0A553BR80_9FLAO|nr:YfhO family protein [Flavobacterium gawalongense]TRX10719.1 YfhO family protein [Flavobacterium gawalongense]TRX11441.1 YfhO family protein [Flavobacterium gawalongense]TRX29210.1 YfhO family protein [Flavobacterium gawalongense]
MKIINKFYPHALAILGFVLLSLIYFYPVLQGKQIFQSDIAQYTGMAKEQNDFRASDHVEPYWTNSAFGGMPTYQLGAKYPHDYIGMIDDVLRFLPRPADYLFLYFLGFYGLMLVLKIDPLKAFFGALAFGFSTYLIIILGVGHNAKAHAIAYMPLVIAGFILVFRKKYILGGLLTMFATALEINANHFQMTYYLLLFLLILSGYFIFPAVKEKEYKSLLYSFGVLAVAGIFALGANATNLLATAEYADFSTRGKSELTFNPDGSKTTSNSAMTRDYITEYSYGIAESFNLIAPRLFGGSNNEALGTDSKMYNFMIGQGVPEAQANDFVSGMPTYWGDQPIVAAPAYIGAVVFFLGILALFIDKRKIKYVFLSGAIVALVLSWGKNFPILTDFFIDYVPMYNKFRAVSSIQVILELCFPVLAIMGLQSFFKLEKELQWKALWQSGTVALGAILILFFSKSMFSFSGGSDSYFLESYGPGFVDALKEDRRSLYSADLLRSGFFILLSAGVLWLFIKNRLASNTAIIFVGLLMIFDLFFVDKKYVSGKDFMSGREVEAPFQEKPSDVEILKDTTHYRVFEVSGNLSSARTSYFHKSIGGYSAVKPRRMQQLFDYQIAKSNMEILNMLNVKYVIQTDKEGKEFPTSNPNANGNAWFVSEVKLVNSADEEMKALDSLDSKNVVVVNQKEFEIKNKAFAKDSLATITLDSHKPNDLKYTSINSNEGLAVFSEMYYGKGWNAYVDGKKTDHFRVDYVLRGLQIPAGKHTIEFKFEPQVVKTGGTIVLFSSIGMLLLLVGGIYFERKKNRGN